VLLQPQQQDKQGQQLLLVVVQKAKASIRLLCTA
jgi:hypothetical protein